MDHGLEDNLSSDQNCLQKDAPTPPQKLSAKAILRFAIPSAIGMLIFLCPVVQNGQVTIPLGIMSEWLANLIKPIAPQLITLLVVMSATLSFVKSVVKIPAVQNNKFLITFFDTTPFYLVVHIIGAIVSVMCLFSIGPAEIISADTGQTMLSLLGTLIAWFFLASFIMPLLMQYGVMEFVGTLLRDFIRPLFRIPGRAAVDLLASWVGNCNVGVVLTTQQYERGYYTARESITIATCFSAASLPFCLVIAAMLGVDSQFALFYLTLVITGLLSVIIMCRIPPLSLFSDDYYAPVGKRIREDQRGDDPHKLSRALHAACDTAEEAPGAWGILKDGLKMVGGIAFGLMPTVMCYGTIALILATYTPIFTWLSMPFGYYLQLLGVADAFQAAPATIVGFADMIIPAVLGANIPAFDTRFIIGVLSLVQIVYMTEVGTLMLMSKMPINFWQLLLIFLEKTVIALPIIVLLTRLFGISG